MKKAAIVAHPEGKVETVAELKRQGYVIHTPFEDSPDPLAIVLLGQDLAKFYDEIIVA